MLHNCVETIFTHAKLLASQPLPSRNGRKSSEDGLWLPMWRGNTMMMMMMMMIIMMVMMMMMITATTTKILRRRFVAACVEG